MTSKAATPFFVQSTYLLFATLLSSVIVTCCEGQSEILSFDMREPTLSNVVKAVHPDADVLPMVDPSTSMENTRWKSLMDSFRRDFDANCGAACLHVLLRLKGIVLPKSDVYQAIAVTARGASLADLQSAAAGFGLPCSVRNLTVPQLWKLTPPFIIHMKESRNQPGHYLVVFGIVDRPNRVQVIDGTTGATSLMSQSMLYESFSGYVLIPKRVWTFLSIVEMLTWGALISACVASITVLLVPARWLQWPNRM